MLAKVCAIVLAALFPAAAQETLERVLNFPQPRTPQSLQEMVTVMRTVANIRQIFVGTDGKVIVIRGTADEGRLAEWLASALDQPGTAPQEFALAGTSDEKLRVFHLAHNRTPENVQEIAILIRSLADAQFVGPYTPQSAVTLRANPWRMGLAEWLISRLDRPANAPPPAGPQEYRLPGGNEILPPEDVFVRIFYTGARRPAELTGILSAMRSAVKQLPRSFVNTARGAIIVRASAEKIAAAEQVIRQRQ